MLFIYMEHDRSLLEVTRSCRSSPLPAL